MLQGRLGRVHIQVGQRSLKGQLNFTTSLFEECLVIAVAARYAQGFLGDDAALGLLSNVNTPRFVCCRLSISSCKTLTHSEIVLKPHEIKSHGAHDSKPFSSSLMPATLRKRQPMQSSIARLRAWAGASEVLGVSLRQALRQDSLLHCGSKHQLPSLRQAYCSS